MHKRQQPGFTLIEVMVVVVIIGILASIALPSYENSMRKSRRGSAQAFMMDVAQREQAFLLDSRSYAVGADALTTLNMAVPAEVSAFYTIGVTEVAGAPPDFTITATPIAGGKQVPDGVLVLRSDGTKTRAGDASKW